MLGTRFEFEYSDFIDEIIALRKFDRYYQEINVNDRSHKDSFGEKGAFYTQRPSVNRRSRALVARVKSLNL